MRDVGLTVGCSTVIGAVLALMVAPIIQRRLSSVFHISAVTLGPALVIIAIGAVVGGISGWNASKRRKW